MLIKRFFYKFNLKYNNQSITGKFDGDFIQIMGFNISNLGQILSYFFCQIVHVNSGTYPILLGIQHTSWLQEAGSQCRLHKPCSPLIPLSSQTDVNPACWLSKSTADFFSFYTEHCLVPRYLYTQVTIKTPLPFVSYIMYFIQGRLSEFKRNNW